MGVVIDMSNKSVRRLDHLIPDTPRPFRLYHAQKNKWFRWRMYKVKYVACKSAFWLARWLEIGETIEVIDVRSGKLHASYTLRRGPMRKGLPTYYVEIWHETVKRMQEIIKLTGVR